MSAKDWLTQKTISAVLNQTWLAPYGELTNFKLDSQSRSFEGELRLKGEAHPIHIQVQRYELVRQGERTFGTINKISTSREWLTTLAREFMVGKRFELPAAAARLLPMVL